ncbi:NfeD family protein [Jiangella anatolica]|uniref:Uncharacterized protein n=1 Tax=Jiangella anatolica TaxID=2670374 RepID=A0A2W2C0Q0_9ACTN|nr:NfeD family protein [Jiangella anatolica]PZF81527.1 hypothetical protein C1I92_20760 [Jiangella anatolica]
MTIYLVLGIAGLAFLLVSLLAGEFLDGVLHLDTDWFSSAAVAAFVSAFGFCASLAQSADVGTPATLGLGAVAGVAFAALTAWLTRMLKNSATDQTPRTADIVGYDGVVVSSIPEAGFGVVNISVGGHLTRLNARATETIESGAAVTVVGVLSPTAVSVARL